MNDIEPSAKAYVMSEIIGYLETRPDAADTLDGIVRWWITQQRHRIGRRIVSDALDELVSHGRLQRFDHPRTGVLYSAVAKPSPA